MKHLEELDELFQKMKLFGATKDLLEKLKEKVEEILKGGEKNG